MTSTVPVPGGDVAVMELSLSTVIAVALVPPNPTLVAPVNPVPVMATEVPPAGSPVFGLIAVTAGGACAA